MCKEHKTICDDCIHYEICGEEGHLDPALVSCYSKKVFGKDTDILKFSDVMRHLDNFFTVVRRTGEMNCRDAYSNPDKYKVHMIMWDKEQELLCVALDEIK